MLQKGFSAVFILIGVVLVLSCAVFLAYKLTSKNEGTFPSTVIYSEKDRKTDNRQSDQDTDEPPLKIKNIGVNIDYYDPLIGKAGDFVFTKEKLQFNRIFMGFGFVIPSGSSSSGKDKSNPQPTFILPLGTPVRSLVDGVVADMPTLWSGDISVQVTTSGKLQRWVYEVEHVINPKVKVGDRVIAGQIIAEVSNFDKGAPDGFGAVEIGILHGGGEGPPEHVCPFLYLDPSVKEDLDKKIVGLFESWEEFANDQTLYDESLSTTPGCLTLDPVEG